MKSLDLFFSRKTARSYTPEPLTPEQIEALKKVALSAPTGSSPANTEFIFVTNRETLSALSHMTPTGWAPFIASSALSIVVLGRKGTLTCVEACSIAAAHLQLAAHALGLGSCWAQAANVTNPNGKSAEDLARALLGFSNNLMLECVVAIGNVPHPPTSEIDRWSREMGRIREVK